MKTTFVRLVVFQIEFLCFFSSSDCAESANAIFQIDSAERSLISPSVHIDGVARDSCHVSDNINNAKRRINYLAANHTDSDRPLM